MCAASPWIVSKPHPRESGVWYRPSDCAVSQFCHCSPPEAIATKGSITACCTPGIRNSATGRYLTGKRSQRTCGVSFIAEPTISTEMAGRNIEKYASPMSALSCPPVSPTTRLSPIDSAYAVATKMRIAFMPVFLENALVIRDSKRLVSNMALASRILQQ